MFPTVDFCFKELMRNEKVRKGIIAALLGVRPKDQNEEGIIRWMRFLNAKSRKELKEMAKQDEYFGEAYEELERLSADEKKRLEYETRLKYKRDKYAQLHYATRIGREEAQSEMIRSMWKAGISEEQIASIAQKTVEEVRKLCK